MSNLKVVFLVVTFFVLGLLSGVYLDGLGIAEGPKKRQEVRDVKKARETSGPIRADTRKLDRKSVLEAVRKGGHVLFFRHTARDRFSEGDTQTAFDNLPMTRDKLEHPDLRKAICLNEQGRAEAWLLGKVFRQLDIPIGKVMSSPTCRTKELATIAFGRIDIITPKLSYVKMQTEAERPVLRDGLKALLATHPAEGRNTILTSHANTLKHIGINVKLLEGDAAVFKPSGEGNYELVAHVRLSDWVLMLDRGDML